MADTLVRRYYAAFNEHRVADAAALFARDATVEQPPFTGSLRGGDAYVQFAQTWVEAFPDARLTIEHVEQRGDTICEVDLVATGTHRGVLRLGAYGTLNASGLQAVLRMRELLEVQSGRITYASLSFNIHDLIYQLAFVDYPRLNARLARIQQIREDLFGATDDPDRRRQLTEDLGRELDAARLTVRPWYRR